MSELGKELEKVILTGLATALAAFSGDILMVFGAGTADAKERCMENTKPRKERTDCLIGWLNVEQPIIASERKGPFPPHEGLDI